VKTTSDSKPHIPVMTEECLQHFEGLKINRFFEGTLGAGGHAGAILEAHPEIATYIGCDRDPEALEMAKQVLEPWMDKLVLVNSNFDRLDQVLKDRKIDSVDGFFLT
jgi:16S rRNA (cytosine1402-N4)-methyltransferase